MWLHVGNVGFEQCFNTLYCEGLSNVNELASAVIAFPRIALDRAGGWSPVLRCKMLELRPFPAAASHVLRIRHHQGFRPRAVDLLVIDRFGLVEAIAHDMKQLATEIHRRPVREVASMSQRHPQYRVTRLQHRQIHRSIGLAA